VVAVSESGGYVHGAASYWSSYSLAKTDRVPHSGRDYYIRLRHLGGVTEEDKRELFNTVVEHTNDQGGSVGLYVESPKESEGFYKKMGMRDAGDGVFYMTRGEVKAHSDRLNRSASYEGYEALPTYNPVTERQWLDKIFIRGGPGEDYPANKNTGFTGPYRWGEGGSRHFRQMWLGKTPEEVQPGIENPGDLQEGFDNFKKALAIAPLWKGTAWRGAVLRYRTAEEQAKKLHQFDPGSFVVLKTPQSMSSHRESAEGFAISPSGTRPGENRQGTAVLFELPLSDGVDIHHAVAEDYAGEHEVLNRGEKHFVVESIDRNAVTNYLQRPIIHIKLREVRPSDFDKSKKKA
jgi:hypothetical protein